MRTKIIKPSSAFNTIVCYKWSGKTKYLGETTSLSDQYLNSYSSSNVYYRASDSKLNFTQVADQSINNKHKYQNVIDFAEYGIKFKPYKEKFNNLLNLNFLYHTSITKDAGKTLSELKKLENYPLYTENIVSDAVLDYGFFGSDKVSEGDLYLLDIPEDCYKIELYSGVDESNCTTLTGVDYFIDYDFIKVFNNTYKSSGKELTLKESPSIIITLGPDEKEYLNPDNLYESSDKYFGKINPRTDLLNSLSRHGLKTSSEEDLENSKKNYISIYRSLKDEIYSRKLIWFLALTNNPSSIKVNISTYSWTKNNNPLRNRNKYSLRNDEYLGFKNYPNTIYLENNKYVFNRITDSNLGVISDTHPILDLKKSLKDNNYSKYINYNKGDKVFYQGHFEVNEEKENVYVKDSYISLIDDNKGNIPNFSEYWMLSDVFEGYFTKNIYFMSDQPGAVTFNPSFSTIPHNQELSIDIIAEEHPGFTIDKLSTLRAIFNKNKKDAKILKLGEDYTYSSSGNKKIFTILNWSNIVNADKIVFSTNSDAIEINIKILCDGVEYDLKDFKVDTVLAKGFKHYKLYDSGMINFTNLNNIRILKENIKLNDEYKVDIYDAFKNSVSLKLKSFKSIHETPSGTVIKDFGTDLTITDKLDATKVTYLIEVERVKKKVSIEYDTRVYEVNVPTLYMNYGSSSNRTDGTNLVLFYRIKDPIINDYRGELGKEEVKEDECKDKENSKDRDIEVICYRETNDGISNDIKIVKQTSKDDAEGELKNLYIPGGVRTASVTFKEDGPGFETDGTVTLYEYRPSGQPTDEQWHEITIQNITCDIKIILNTKYK